MPPHHQIVRTFSWFGERSKPVSQRIPQGTNVWTGEFEGLYGCMWEARKFIRCKFVGIEKMAPNVLARLKGLIKLIEQIKELSVSWFKASLRILKPIQSHS